jgi:predicted nuclease of predicted toxin-antitoxin system
MKILLDMNLSPTWVPLLIDAGFDAVHWVELGPANALDTVLFEWARSHGAIVFTHDLDFGSLLALTGAEAPSVFQIRTHDVTPRVLGSRAIELLRRFENELNEGALIVADELRERIRLLPLAK